MVQSRGAVSVRPKHEGEALVCNFQIQISRIPAIVIHDMIYPTEIERGAGWSVDVGQLGLV